MSVSERSTKAEILAAYSASQAALAAGPSWPQIWAKFRALAVTVQTESIALVKDCYRSGQWLRRCYDQAVAELSQPLFKS
jgi:hypothetical protein